VETETTKQVAEALHPVCRHQKCIGRDAIIEAAERLLPETGDWIVRKNDDRLRLYAIREGTVHELGAECIAVDERRLLDRPETAECHYRVLRLAGGETFTCRIERTEGGAGTLKTRTSWSFKLADPIDIAYGSDDDDAQRADSFAQALVEAIAVAPIAI
jgi:hypothetical protein